jgi:hypothetical protein
MRKKPVHETAVVPTPETDGEVPPPTEQAEPPPTSKPNNIVEAFMQLSTTVKVTLGAAAFVGVIAVANQSGSAVVLAVILLIVAGIAFVRPEEGSGATVTVAEPVSAEPISEAERTQLLDEAIGGYLRKGFLSRSERRLQPNSSSRRRLVSSRRSSGCCYSG